MHCTHIYMAFKKHKLGNLVGIILQFPPFLLIHPVDFPIFKILV